MKTAMIIWNLVYFISLCTNFGKAATKRRNPGPNEIERVINETHSVMWICEKAECPPGLGLNVHCGTSIPFSMPIKCVSCVEGANFSDTTNYSTCKGCKICGKNEKKTGKCTLEEDTTNCSGICYKGFYMDAISGECHPCSDCCGQSDKYEKQCKDSGYPSSKQCRMHNLNCFETTTKSSAESKDHDKDQKGLEALEIVFIVVGIIVFAAIVIFVILGILYGRDEIRSTLVSCFCYCCRLEASNGRGNTMYFDVADGQAQRYEHDLEQGTGKSEHNFTETPERTTDTELSDLLDQHQIQFRPPAKTEKTQRGIFRSFSHPGALNPKLQKETSNSNCIPLQCFGSPKPNKLISKRGYSLVATELSDEAVFTRNSSTSIARVQPMKLERFAKSSVKTQHTSTTGLYLAVTSETLLNGIPQDFQNNLLSKKMSAIPFKLYSRICAKLNIKRFAFDDFHLLAEEIGLTQDFTLWLSQLENPTHQIITKYYNTQEGSCVGKFREMLEGMNRIDVVDLIDEWVRNEWLKQCNSSTVNSRPKTYV